MRPSDQVYRRRRLGALGVVAAAAALGGGALGASHGDRSGGPAGAATTNRLVAAKPPPPPQLPRGGRRIFPDWRVVALYGAPQSAELGALGIGTPDQAAARLQRQAKPYARKTRPILPAFELIATVANAHPGRDGMYRTRQPSSVIRRYLAAARRHRALLVLDIQPGHADFLAEVRHLEPWLRQPDVGVALDPEWHTPGAQPGTVIGSTDAATINAVSARVADIVRRYDLPEKLFIVHQFTASMITDKAAIVARPGLATTINVDGFGDRANKVAKYREFTRDGTRFNDGFKLFYEEDTGLMAPALVLSLGPPPDLVVYE